MIVEWMVLVASEYLAKPLNYSIQPQFANVRTCHPAMMGLVMCQAWFGLKAQVQAGLEWAQAY